VSFHKWPSQVDLFKAQPMREYLRQEVLSAMISGGNTTVYVSDMDAAIRFYTEALGLKLTNRLGTRWATVEAGASYWTTDDVGAGLIIGLHPQSLKNPSPGTKGSVMFGLETYDPIEDVMARLVERGVRTTGEVIRTEIGNFVGIEDLDGNAIYLWEISEEMVPQSDLGSKEGPGQSAVSPMLSGGHANIYVSSMDATVRFYTEVLGLKLTNRFDDHWATVEAGNSLVIGLHPESPRYPAPGTKGAVVLGLEIDEPIERVVSRLLERGVRTTGAIVRSELENVAEIEDPDGNAIRLGEPVSLLVK
jgi:predicted enzyme related to lactoylglutathione lyase